MSFLSLRMTSQLHNEKTFYSSFAKDLKNCRSELIIESPYITASRMESLYPIFQVLLDREVRIYIVTRDPIDHEDDYMRHQATNEILQSTELGINIILLKGFHHRKLAIIDKGILWEGSLNILSHNSSLEIMRRIDEKRYAKEMISFLKLEKLI